MYQYLSLPQVKQACVGSRNGYESKMLRCHYRVSNSGSLQLEAEAVQQSHGTTEVLLHCNTGLKPHIKRSLPHRYF